MVEVTQQTDDKAQNRTSRKPPDSQLWALPKK